MCRPVSFSRFLFRRRLTLGRVGRGVSKCAIAPTAEEIGLPRAGRYAERTFTPVGRMGHPSISVLTRVMEEAAVAHH